LFAAALAAMLHVGEPQAAAQQKKKEPPKKQPVAQPEDLYVAPGFKAELLYVSDPGTQGSWINMCTEKPGKLIVAGQGGQPILRFTIKEGKVDGAPEKLGLGITEAMGLLYHKGVLYVNGNGPKGYGLYKCVEGEAAWKVTPLKIFGAGGEHGAHGLAIGPDEKLYIINGNHTNVPDGLSKNSPHRNWAEDHLLPRQPDGNGHATGRMAPGGYVLRTDLEGKDWEILLGGFRNAYDIAFNGDGELFAFDSDMEWDWGMPWYRPTRVNHLVSGAEFGWRYGTGKWPAYYADSLPGIADIGIGSPTGVGNGIGAKFPAKYQKAIYICDWTYGRLIAVHLKPKGASFETTFENFVCPLGLMKPGGAKKPLNLTDVVIGSDGALYFTIGGRNAQAALYRVTYVGDEKTDPADLTNKDGTEARELRKKLEAFHGKQHKDATNTAIKHLGSPDRELRFAARVALESQPVVEWKTLVLNDKNPDAVFTGCIALARTGDAKTQPELLAALEKFPLAKLTDEQKLEKLRALQLSFIRQGPPAGGAKKLIAELDAAFPGPNEAVNREAFQLLVYLNAPGIVAKGLKKIEEAKTQQDLFHYLFHLRTAPIGSWTMQQRKQYLGYWTKRPNLPQDADTVAWFKTAGRDYGNGSSFNNFLKNFLREAVANMSAAEQKELAPVIASINKDITPSFDVKPRDVVKKWTMEEIQPLLAKVESGRDFNKGKEAYAAAQCIKCHRFGETGGSIGPDLTAIGSRFAAKDILESIIDPSKTLSDQYQNETFRTASGKTVTGRVVDDSKDSISVQPDPLSPERVVLMKDDIESRTPSKVSPMPANLADVLTPDEILDLIAYMQASGKKTKAFK
jgi:putative heme-binding domain-containing protein